MVSIETDKPVYFASDQHLGAPNRNESRSREDRFVAWLDAITPQTEVLFLLGDLFDFWFEYKEVVPRGFVRVLGTLAKMRDQGIQIYFFVGNHDLWMSDYFETELGIPVYRKPQAFHIHGQKLLIGHGDGLGPNDKGYKRMKKLFTHPLAKWAFSKLHPNHAVRLGRKLSLNNRLISGSEDHSFKGRENEWLIAYCERKLESKEYDSFVFGHRHFPMKVKLSKGAYYFNTGDWIHYDTFGVLDDKGFRLESLKGHEIPSY